MSENEKFAPLTIRLEQDGNERYFLWSEVIHRPISSGLTKDEYINACQAYGENGNLPSIIKQLHETGTNSGFWTLDKCLDAYQKKRNGEIVKYSDKPDLNFETREQIKSEIMDKYFVQRRKGPCQFTYTLPSFP